MWALGVTSLLRLAGGMSLAAGWRTREPQSEIWDVAGTARTYTTIVGTLAGFSITSSIFIANLTVARESAAFESVMALFLVAFLLFISAAMQFGTTPNLSSHPHDAYRTVQGYSYVLANQSYYMGLSLSWVGLPLLLSVVGLDYLANVFIWLVLFALLGGAVRMCAAGLNTFVGVDLRVCLGLPVLCFALASAYRLGLATMLDSLLPAEHEIVLFAVTCFVLGATGFTLQSFGASSVRHEELGAAVARVGPRVLLPYTAGVVTASSLLWLATASAL